jgi:hypothetical protein
MRRLFLSFCVLAALATAPGHAQDMVQQYSGSGATTTGFFTTTNRWEVRWNARQAISVAVLSNNGTLVAGASGVLRGSLFVPAGGQYYLKITDGTVPLATPPAPKPPSTNAPPAPGASTNAPPAAVTNAPPAASTNVVTTPITNAAPAPHTEVIPEPAPIVPEVDTPTAPPVSWHVQIVQIPATVSATDTLTVYTPYFTIPDAVITPVTPQPAPPPPTLTADQMRAMVTITGDNAQGNGFLLRTADGLFVACHLHLLSDNPKLQITSSSGAPIKILSAKAATDRDLALIAVQDDHLSALPVPAQDDNSAMPGDTVIIPAVGESDALGGKPGKIVDFSPGRVDLDDALDGNSKGAPVILVKNSQALAIVTAEKRIDLSPYIAKAWQGNPAPGSETIIPFYGLTLKDVAGWEAISLSQFNDEGAFLDKFHETTRCMDSFLNGRRHRPNNPQFASDPPDSKYYTHNDRISAAADSYHKLAVDADPDQSLDAARVLLSDLQAVADTGMNRLHPSGLQYTYNRRRAEEELAYRKAIKAELDYFSDNIPRLSAIAQSR